jgi:hypothetical protein
MNRTQPQAPTCTDATYLDVVLREFGCCRCQAYHREGEPLFAAHLMFQSKNSYREVDVFTAIVEAAAAAK